MNTQVKSPTTEIHANKKALFDYEVISVYEAGIKLMGAEIKSVRAKHCNLKWSYVSLHSGRPILIGMHISPYEPASSRYSLDPTRERELFLKKKDIESLSSKVREKGISLVPTEVYQKGNLVKISVALVRGRKGFDKKQLLKERDLERDAQRSISERM